MIAAAYCGTRGIYADMENSAKSLIATTPVDKVYFIIEDEAFPHPLPDIIECIDMSGQTFFDDGFPNAASQYTWMAAMRITLCHVLPHLDRVLSLDADTVFMKDASALWDTDMDGCYFAAVPEWHRSKDGLVYCNFGVVLYNLEQLRDGKADECIGVLNRNYYRWVEQDVGNYLCQGRIRQIPALWNSNWWTDKCQSAPVIRHFAGDPHEEWWDNLCVVRWRNTTWDEVMALHG